MAENVVYQDKVKSSPMIVALLGLSVFVVVVIGLVLYSQQSMTMESEVFYILVMVCVVDVMVLLVFRQMQIVITDKELKFGFYIFKKKIDLSKIENVEIQDFKFSNYFGYGIRYGRDNTVGYVPSGGRGLKIRASGERREFFFICNRPEEAMSFIKQYGKQK